MTGTDALRRARFLCLAIIAGAVVYAIVAVLVGRAGGIGTGLARRGDALVVAWIVVASAGMAAWVVVWRRASEAGRSADARRRIAAGEIGAQRVLQLLVVAWAALEAVALTGFTITLLTGRTLPSILSVALLIAGAWVSYPRAEWFAPFGRPAG